MGERAACVHVVDDDRDIRGMLSQVLELEGYQVVAAANGQEAMQNLQHGSRPCLILLDLMMPVMNGWEFCRAQAEHPELGGIPVIVLSGDDGPTARAKIAELGVAGYLIKPIDLDTLLSTVKRYA